MASREAVAELEDFGDTGCPICGAPSWRHTSERVRFDVGFADYERTREAARLSEIERDERSTK